MSQLTLDEAKAYLKQESNGTNLYDHLSEVLLKILVDRPQNSCEAFENISSAVKQARVLPDTSNQENVNSSLSITAKEEQEKWCNSTYNLLKPPNEEEPPEPATGVSDILDEANMFEWAGVGFSRGETYRLSLSIQKLATTFQTISMRLWGKILGVNVGYYVAEGLLSEPFEPEDASIQEGSTGSNKFTYWIMRDDGNYEWIQLPPVTQAQILKARKLKRFVRDDLDGVVKGNPPFPGTEKNFIRAQIARISSSTIICPNGFFQVNEEGEIETAEEIESKTAEELADLSNWVHYTKELNSVYGRCTPLPARENEEGEEIPWEGEEFIEPLRSISEDTAGIWRLDRVPSLINPAVGELAIVKSLLWPGAVSVGLGKKFLNVYVGYGTKYTEEEFQPELPGKIQTEYGVGIDESTQEEPTPKLAFVNLQEQEDVLEDPTPPEEGEEE